MATRTFADDLKGRSDHALQNLLAARPDLLTPLASDLTALAIRATSTHSILRALDNLNSWEIDILLAAATLDEPFLISDLTILTDESAADTLEKLYELGLIYLDQEPKKKAERKFRLPTNLRTILGEDPAGLGPKAVIKCDLKLLAKAPKEARAVLEKLTWGVPRGQVSNLKNPPVGVAWLLENDFLTVLDSHTVALPREVGLFLRGNKIFAEIKNNPPELTGKEIEQAKVDSAAIANITDLLRWCEELANYWANDPATILRTGGIGVRDLKRSCEHLGLAEQLTTFIAELLFQSALIAIDGNGEVLPTQNYDLWLKKDPEEKWRDLAIVWRKSNRYLAKNAIPLSDDLERGQYANNKELFFTALTELLSLDESSLLANLEWRAPRKYNPDYYLQIAQEASWLGITAFSALSIFGKNFILGNSSLGISAASPEPIDFILVQSDYTAIAPGPLVNEIADKLELIADIEGRGSATVFRFTETSIRRGFDHGLQSSEILDFLKITSKTPIPQPLEYLISDTAKKHGKIRIGQASSFLRSDDETIISEIILNKELEPLMLRKIAPTVLISDLEAADLLASLRAEGYFPVAEGRHGVMLSSPTSRRIKVNKRSVGQVNNLLAKKDESDNLAALAIRALRVGDKVTSAPTFDLPKTSASATLKILSDHIAEGSTVTIGYADTNGQVSNRLIDPLSIRQGILTAKDHATGKIEPFRIPRITGVIAD